MLKLIKKDFLFLCEFGVNLFEYRYTLNNKLKIEIYIIDYYGTMEHKKISFQSRTKARKFLKSLETT